MPLKASGLEMSSLTMSEAPPDVAPLMIETLGSDAYVVMAGLGPM